MVTGMSKQIECYSRPFSRYTFGSGRATPGDVFLEDAHGNLVPYNLQLLYGVEKSRNVLATEI